MTDTTLSDRTMDLVESTIPILEEQCLAITTRFYGRLFNEYPEFRPMFAAAAPGQAERFATAILAYANNIRDLERVGPAVERIAKKHVVAGVAPMHYDIVGQIFLGSMVEVLGQIDMEVLDAWSAAYEFLAEIFISVEAEMADVS